MYSSSPLNTTPTLCNRISLLKKKKNPSPARDYSIDFPSASLFLHHLWLGSDVRALDLSAAEEPRALPVSCDSADLPLHSETGIKGCQIPSICESRARRISTKTASPSNRVTSPVSGLWLLPANARAPVLVMSGKSSLRTRSEEKTHSHSLSDTPWHTSVIGTPRNTSTNQLFR